MKRQHFSSLLVISTMIAAGAATSAQAQSMKEPAAEAQGGQLADIIVVAQRRSERLQDVPIAIDVVGSQELTKANIENVYELGQMVPGFVATRNHSTGGLFARIRGVGSAIGSAGYENPVAVYLDGVYLAAQNGPTLRLNNIDRVEILKGPQGTLFGRNATGGVINVITRDPKQEFSGKFSIGYDSYRTLDMTAYVTGGLAPNLAIDISGLFKTQDRPYGRNIFNGSEFQKVDYEFAVRSKLLWTPGDGTTIRVVGDYSGTQTDLGYTVPIFDSPFQGLFPKAALAPYDGDYNSKVGRKFRGGGVSAEVQQDIGSLQLINIFAWRDQMTPIFLDLDGTRVDVGSLAYRQFDRQLSNELRLQSNDNSSFRWVLGAYYLRYNSGYDPGDIVFGPAGAPLPTSARLIRFESGQVSTSIAGFGQASVELAEGTTATAGLRFTQDKARRYGTNTVVLNNGTTTPGITALLPVSKTNDAFSWRLSLDHKFAKDVLVYASYNRGFKSGGYNPNAADKVGYLTETIDAYEVGLKSDVIPGVLRFNVSAYLYDYRNPQLSVIVNNVAATRNSPKANIHGVEADLRLVPAEGLVIDAGVSWNHGRFGTFLNAPFYVGCAGAAPCSGNASGNRLDGVPDWTLSGAINYTVPLANGHSIELHGDIAYQSSFSIDVAQTYVEPGFAIAKASVTWRLPGDRISVRAYIDNITNDDSFRRTQIIALGGTFGTRNDPRTFGTALSFEF